MKVTNQIEHYEKDAELFDYFEESNKIENDYSKRMHQAVLSLIEGNNKNILDIGSGNGWIAEENKYFNNVTLVDLSIKNLSKIKNRYKNSDINYLLADAAELPIKNEIYDYIILSEVLEHLNEPLKVLGRIYAILKTGGKAIITTPYNEVIRYYLCVHCNKKTPANAHLHVFNEKVMSDILNELKIKNYKFLKIGNSFSLKFRLSYIMKIFPFSIWSLFDKFFNFLNNKPFTIITIIEK